ncbi:hypothetical protein KCU67_g6273, partial [Aureobasidium melanogenum]
KNPHAASGEHVCNGSDTWVTTNEGEMLILEMARADLTENKDKRSHLKTTQSIQHKVIQNSMKTDMSREQGALPKLQRQHPYNVLVASMKALVMWTESRRNFQNTSVRDFQQAQADNTMQSLDPQVSTPLRRLELQGGLVVTRADEDRYYVPDKHDDSESSVSGESDDERGLEDQELDTDEIVDSHTSNHAARDEASKFCGDVIDLSERREQNERTPMTDPTQKFPFLYITPDDPVTTTKFSRKVLDYHTDLTLSLFDYLGTGLGERCTGAYLISLLAGPYRLYVDRLAPTNAEDYTVSVCQTYAMLAKLQEALRQYMPALVAIGDFHDFLRPNTGVDAIPTDGEIENLLPLKPFSYRLAIDLGAEHQGGRYASLTEAYIAYCKIVASCTVPTGVLDSINDRLKTICGSDKDFGGKSVIFSGDFFQLPPVGGTPMFMVNPLANGADKDLEQLYSCINKSVFLTTPMRQKDAAFDAELTKIRNGDGDAATSDYLSGRVLANMQPP